MGKITDHAGNPVQYASVVYLKKKVGITSNEKGIFSLPKETGDSIKISCVGYTPKIIFIDSTITFLSVLLDEQVVALNEVTVNGRFKKWKIIGTKRHDHTFTDKGGIQMQFAYYIENTDKLIGRIDEIRFQLGDLQYRKFPLRIRLYDRDNQTGLPGKDLLLKNNIIPAKSLHKYSTFKIANENVSLPDNGVFVSFEWICTDKNCSYYNVPSFPGSRSTQQNTRYFNYKELKWVAAPDFENGYFGTMSLQFKVSY